MEPENRAYNPSLDDALEHQEPSRMKEEPDDFSPRKLSGRAVASLVLGIFSTIGGGILLAPPVLAVVFGHLAVGDCNRDHRLEGKGLAIAGLILGWITLTGWILLILLFGGLAYLMTALNGS